MDPKIQAVVKHIERIEDAIIKGREYLESGDHADWPGFRSLFHNKVQNGKAAPPHRDWVQNVFLPRSERALRRAEKALQRLERDAAGRTKDELPPRTRPSPQ